MIHGNNKKRRVLTLFSLKSRPTKQRKTNSNEKPEKKNLENFFSEWKTEFRNGNYYGVLCKEKNKWKIHLKRFCLQKQQW